MTKGQKYLLKLFEEVDTICKKHNIRYYLAGGTLIGAVRHKGFIPWDDDMDLYMTRDEFNKLAAVAKEGGLPSGRVLECQEINRGYRNVFGRYTDLSTTAIHKSQLISKDMAGEVLDIFQLDPIPKSKRLKKKYFKSLMLYSDLINPTATYSSRRGWNKYLYLAYSKLAGIIGMEAVLKYLERGMFCYDEALCDEYIMRWAGAPLIYRKELFEPALTAEFEGITCTIPKRYSEYLIYHYGTDWMYLPEVNQQESHVAVRSLTHNYEIVRSLYMQYIDTEEITKKYQQRKLNSLSTIRETHKEADIMVNIRGERLREELLVKISRKNIDVIELYDNHNYSELIDLFNDYFQMQKMAQFIGRNTFIDYYRYEKPILIDLPVHILVVALNVENDIGKDSLAYRTIEVYQYVKKRLPKELSEIKDRIVLQREAANKFSLNELDEALIIADNLIVKSPYNIFLIKLIIEILLKKQENIERIKELINQGQEISPQDGDFIKYEGDLLYYVNKDLAFDYYLKARANTNNGLNLLDIKEKTCHYVDSLLHDMNSKFIQNDYQEAKSIYKKIVNLKTSPEIEYSYINGMLQAELDFDTLYDFYNKTNELIGQIDNRKIENLLIKILGGCGEYPIAAKEHIAVLYFMNNKEGDLYQIRKRIEEKIYYLDTIKSKQQVLIMRKLIGDLQRSEGKLQEAYSVYMEIYNLLDNNTIEKRVLRELFEADINKMRKMKYEDNIDINIIRYIFNIKFKSLKMIKSLTSSIDLSFINEILTDSAE